jgi:dienelactone hydrolase
MRAPALLVVAAALAAAPAAPEDRFLGPVPAEASMTVTRDLVYATVDGKALKADVVRPAALSSLTPVVVLVNGIGAEWMRAHAQYAGWARAVTSRGMAGITMDGRSEATTAEDVEALLAHLRTRPELGLDVNRVVLWSCSANVKAGLPLAMDPTLPYVKGAVVYYGHATVPRFRPDVPVLFARAGLDNPGLNEGLDGLVAQASRENAPVQLVNYPAGQHAFDLRDDTALTRRIIDRTLDFMAAAVQPATSAEIAAGVPKAAAAGAVQRGDWAEAARAYEGLTRGDPRDAIAWQRLGEARLELGQHEAAIAALDEALKLETPNRGMVSFAAARAHAALGQPDRAVERLLAMKRWLRFFKASLEQDAVFAEVRRHPRYAEVLAP